MSEERNILMIVDMIRAFHDLGALANPRTAKIIPNIVKLISGDWDDIVVVKDCHQKNDKEFEIFPPHAIEGTEEIDLIEEIRDALEKRNWSYMVVEKTRFSALYKTWLGDYGPRLMGGSFKCTVVGICSDICVLHTVADLRMRDIEVTVLANCIETFDAPGHDADEWNKLALEHMQHILGARVLR